MSIINLVSGLAASKHWIDFNYYNYYVSKHAVVKLVKKKITLKYQRGKKSLASPRLRPQMYTYIWVLGGVTGGPNDPIAAFLFQLATRPLTWVAGPCRKTKAFDQSNNKPSYTYFSWFRTHDSLNKELVTTELHGTLKF